FLNVTPHLFKRVGRVQAVRAVLEITRPIRQFVLCRPGQERRDHRACHQCREEPDKSPLIHCSIPSRIDIGNRNSLNLGFESAAIVHLFFLFSSGRFGWWSLTVKGYFRQSSAPNTWGQRTSGLALPL